MNQQTLTAPPMTIHLRLNGAKQVEIDHANDTAYAWRGGAEVLTVCCADGNILRRSTLDDLGVSWSLSETSLNDSVKSALRRLVAGGADRPAHQSSVL